MTFGGFGGFADRHRRAGVVLETDGKSDLHGRAHANNSRLVRNIEWANVRVSGRRSKSENVVTYETKNVLQSAALLQQ